MRIFLILICSIALVSLAPEVHAGKHKDKKSGDGSTVSKSAKKAQAKSADWTKPKGAGKAKPVNTWNDSNTVKYLQEGEKLEQRREVNYVIQRANLPIPIQVEGKNQTLRPFF